MAISFSAGQLLTAAQLNLLCPIYAVAPSDQAVTNSNARVPSTYITFTLLPQQTYEIDANIVAQVTVNSCHLSLAWAVTGTVAAPTSGAERMVIGSPDTATAAPDSMLVQVRAFALTTGNLNTMTTINSNYYVRERLLLNGGASGGTVTLQFAQFTAVAAQSAKLMAGTYATARVIS